MTQNYLDKKVEWRKLRLIDKFFYDKFTNSGNKMLDLGCGPGEYGPYLKKKCNYLVGIDYDIKLLDVAKKREYDKLRHTLVRDKLEYEDYEFDNLWSSEFLEHLPNLKILDELERITTYTMVITIPNPLSPHFKRDKTHILKYSVRGLKKFLRKRKGWNYKVIGLGFDDIPGPDWLKKLTSYLLYYIPELSPTIAIIGERELPNAYDIILGRFGLK